MNISNFSRLLFFTAISLVGFALIPRLQFQWLPSSQLPALHVSYYWADASPAILEQAVTSPLEGAFSLLPGIKKINSESGRSSGRITLELNRDTDLSYFRFEVANTIRRLWPQLPQGVSYPDISLSRPDEAMQERPLLTYALSAPATPTELFSFAQDQLAPQMAATPGIGSIAVTGGNRMEWVIRYEESLLASLSIKRNELLLAIKEQFQNQSIGLARQGIIVNPVRVAIALPGNLDNNPGVETQSSNIEWPVEKERLESIVVASRSNRLIRVDDVAAVHFEEQKPRNYYRINGQNSLRLLLYPERGANQLKTAQLAKKLIDEIALAFPKGYSLALEHDGSKTLQNELDKILQRTLLSLIILLLFAAFVYRSWKYVFLIISALVINLGIAFIFYDLFNVQLHIYALAGITLSFGMVIDNSIIMAHHLSTNLRKGAERLVWPALAACTLTTLASLVVLFFLDEAWRLQLSDFAAVIIINLSVSLAVAFWFIPALMDKMNMTSPAGQRQRRHFYRNITWYRYYGMMVNLLLHWRKTSIAAMVLLFGLPIFMLPSKIESWDWYNKTLGSVFYRESIKPHLDKITGGTLRLFTNYVWEGSGWREPEETLLFVQGALPFGGTTAQLNNVFRKVEAYVLQQHQSDIRQMTTEVNSGQFGMTTIRFPKGSDPALPYILRSRLIQFSLNFGGVKWNIYGVGKGFSNDAANMPPSYHVVFRGYNKEELQDLTERLAGKLEAHPRVQKINTNANINWWEKDLYELVMQPDAKHLAERKLTSVQLVNALREYNQAPSPDFYTPGNIPLRLENSKLSHHDLWLLQNKTQRIDSLMAFFPDLTRIEKMKVTTSVQKEDQQYLRLLAFEYTGSTRFGQQFLDRCLAELRQEIPLGYSAKQTRHTWGSGKRKPYAVLVLVMAMIFFICAIQFNSLRQGLANLLLIPASFIGIFLTFYWGDFYFDQGGYAAFLLVSGQAVSGLILIISDYNRFKKIQKRRNEVTLFLKAFRQKITPVVLTVFSTVLGLIPFLALGEQEIFWFSLAVGASGGLLFSLLVIVFFMPVLLLKATGGTPKPNLSN